MFSIFLRFEEKRGMTNDIWIRVRITGIHVRITMRGRIEEDVLNCSGHCNSCMICVMRIRITGIRERITSRARIT